LGYQIEQELRVLLELLGTPTGFAGTARRSGMP